MRYALWTLPHKAIIDVMLYSTSFCKMYVIAIATCCMISKKLVMPWSWGSIVCIVVCTPYFSSCVFRSAWLALAVVHMYRVGTAFGLFDCAAVSLLHAALVIEARVPFPQFGFSLMAMQAFFLTKFFYVSHVKFLFDYFSTQNFFYNLRMKVWCMGTLVKCSWGKVCMKLFLGLLVLFLALLRQCFASKFCSLSAALLMSSERWSNS